MFRLVKVLNGNNQCDIFKIKSSVTASIIPGCALVCSNGALANATATVCPDYVALGKDTKEKGIIDAMVVTEDMIFKVEYTGTTVPYVGMAVSLSTGKYKMDSVTNNSSGKGVILALEDDKKLVHVRFRK